MGTLASEKYLLTIAVINLEDIGLEFSETNLCKILRKEEQTISFDVFCFSLSILEMVLMSSNALVTHTFKILCKIINKGEL